MTDKIRVRIFGNEYTLDPGGLTHLEASQLASYVDQKMREIADKLRLVDTQKIAVLAALNIALEMTQSSQKNRLTGEDEQKIERMIAVLDRTLKDK
jgi:cell division protein ZapA